MSAFRRIAAVLTASCMLLGYLSARRRYLLLAHGVCLAAAAPHGNQHLRRLYDALQARPPDAEWPDRVATAALWRGLHYAYEPSGKKAVRPNAFATDGPLQTTLFFANNKAVLQIVHEARRLIFEPIVEELRAGLRPRNRAILDRGVWRPHDEALHIIVRVFSEHPSLLGTEEAARWRPVRPEQVERLGEAIAVSLDNPRAPARRACPIPLSLFGYALTDDGSFLTLWEEEEEAAEAGRGASLLKLREALGRVGESVLGELNSRPKALIHMSVARLLEWPLEAALDDAERAHVRRTVGRWRAALKARELIGEPGRPRHGVLPNLGATIWADELELVRDTTWMMTERETLRKFRLGRDPT